LGRAFGKGERGVRPHRGGWKAEAGYSLLHSLSLSPCIALFSCTVNAKCLIVFFEPGTVILVRYLNMNNRGVHKILKRVGF